MNLTIRQKLLAASLAVSGLLMVVGVVAYLTVAFISTDTQAVVRIAEEHDQFVELQLALVKALIPPGEYLISGNPVERANFANHFAAVEAGLGHLRRSTLLSDPLGDVAARLATVKALGAHILALLGPVGSQKGMDLMASLDQLPARRSR